MKYQKNNKVQFSSWTQNKSLNYSAAYFFMAWCFEGSGFSL